MTVAEALDHHGVTWRQLEKISGTALRDALRARNITLDSDRRELAFEYFVDLAAEWSRRYDPELAGGTSFTTSCYRRLYGTPPGAKLIDFLRRHHGDERRGRPLHQIPSGDRADLASGELLDEESFEQLLDHVQSGLTTGALATLRTVAYDIVVLGLERWRIAERHDIDPGEVTSLLDELGLQLRVQGVAA